MRRPRLLLPAVTVGLALFVSACGVTADTTAATVAGRDIPVDDVTALASDPAFNNGADTGNESTQDGTVARGVLLFLIQREAWLAELERWGLEITDADRQAAGQQLDQQLQGTGTGQIEERSRELLLDYGAAQNLLTRRFAQLDPRDDADLRRLYDGAPSRWRQVCLTVVRVPIERVDAAESLVDDRVPVQDLADRVEGAEVVAQPSDGCFPELALLPELRRELVDAPVGVTRGVVLSTGSAGGAEAFVFRLEERRRLSFDDVREELATEARGLAQEGPVSWVQEQTLLAEINPRYGQQVQIGATGFVIEPPTAPVVPRAQRIADAIAAAEAARQITDPAAASG
jgi:hypothetical protein